VARRISAFRVRLEDVGQDVIGSKRGIQRFNEHRVGAKREQTKPKLYEVADIGGGHGPPTCFPTLKRVGIDAQLIGKYGLR
jgi:hypothetical protein